MYHYTININRLIYIIIGYHLNYINIDGHINPKFHFQYSLVSQTSQTILIVTIECE